MGIAAAVALSLGWLVADIVIPRWEQWQLEQSLEDHAWAMSSLEPGHAYQLPSFPVPPGTGAPPTFHASINRYLIREREFKDRPAEGVIRVVAVGDSTTFGTGLALEERFTERLQARLDAKQPGRYEVLNAGRAGMSSVAAADLIEQRVVNWGPALVVVGVMTNDTRDPEHPMRLRPEADGHAQLRTSLKRIAAICSRRNDIGLIFWGNVVLTPGGDDVLHSYRAAMKSEARALDVPYVDLEAVYRANPATAEEQRVFRTERNWTTYWTDFAGIPTARTALFMDMAHPSRAGSKRLAAALEPLILSAPVVDP